MKKKNRLHEIIVMRKIAKNKYKQSFDLWTFASKVYKMNGMEHLAYKLTFLIKNFFPFSK